jgi:hypothetical protein
MRVLLMELEKQYLIWQRRMNFGKIIYPNNFKTENSEGWMPSAPYRIF